MSFSHFGIIQAHTCHFYLKNSSSDLTHVIHHGLAVLEITRKKLRKTFVHIKTPAFIDVHQLTQHPIFQDHYSSKVSLIISIVLSLPKLWDIINFTSLLFIFLIFWLKSPVVTTYLHPIGTGAHTCAHTQKFCPHAPPVSSFTMPFLCDKDPILFYQIILLRFLLLL